MAELAQKEFMLSNDVKQLYFDVMTNDNMDIDGIRLKKDNPSHYKAFSQYLDMLSDDNEAFYDYLNQEYVVFRDFMDGDMPDELSHEYREMEHRFLNVSSWITGPSNYVLHRFTDLVARADTPETQGLTNEAKDFYFERMAVSQMDINGLKLNSDNTAQRAAFYNYIDHVCRQTPAMSGLLLDAFVRLKTYENSMPDNMAPDIENPRYERLIDGVENAMEELESISVFDKVQLFDFAPESDDGALLLKPEDRVNEDNITLPEGSIEEIATTLTEEPAASEMSAEEIAALEARAKADTAAKDLGTEDDTDAITLTGLVENPSDIEIPVLRVETGLPTPPAGGFKPVGPAIRDADAPTDGVTKEGTAIEIDPNALRIEAPEQTTLDPKTHQKTFWEYSDDDIEAIHGADTASQDKFIKKAIADWYTYVGKVEDIDDISVETVFAHLMTNYDHANVLNQINEDIIDRRKQKDIITEFDHTIVDNHLSLEPDAIEKTVGELADGDVQRAKKAKIWSWALPAMGGIGAGVTTSLIVKGGLLATTGLSGFAIGGIGGGLAALASEYTRLSIRAERMPKTNPKLTGHTKTRLMQEAVKDDNIKIIKNRLLKTQKKITKLEKSIKKDEHRVREILDSGAPTAELNRKANKNHSRDIKTLETLKNRRISLFASLKQTEHAPATNYSIGKHLIKRTMLGAVLGAGLGAALSLDVVHDNIAVATDFAQEKLSSAFNTVSGVIFGAADTPVADVTTAGLGLGLPNLDFTAMPGAYSPDTGAIDVAALQDYLASQGGDFSPQDGLAAQFDSYFTGAETDTTHAAAVSPDANPFTTAAAAAHDIPVVTIAPETNTLLEQFRADGVPILSLDSAADAIDAHFGGDVPASLQPYITNLSSDNLAYRNEAMHSIAYLLNNSGERDLANAFMALNIIENGFDSPDPAVTRAIEGLAHYGSHLSDALHGAMDATGHIDARQISGLAERVASGAVELDVLPTNEELIDIANNTPRSPFTPH